MTPNAALNTTLPLLIEAFNQGFSIINGTRPPHDNTLETGRHIIQVGSYNLLDTDRCDLLKEAYGLGIECARSLKYNRRKSIRLGRVYNIQVIYKYDNTLWMFYLPTLGWKATMNVSKVERRTE